MFSWKGGRQWRPRFVDEGVIVIYINILHNMTNSYVLYNMTVQVVYHNQGDRYGLCFGVEETYFKK
jgi:hypothetical protein